MCCPLGCFAPEAGAEIAEAGGNAVDVAIGASLVSLVSEPGMVSLAGGGFLTIWPGDDAPVTVDGAVAMPGIGSAIEPEQAAVRRVVLEYAGGMETLIAHGSVATPGILAAFDLASRHWGRVSWQTLFAPAIRGSSGRLSAFLCGARGGVLGAMDTMYQRGKIQEESMYYEHKKHDGSLPIIGVNTFLGGKDPQTEGGEIELMRSTDEEKDQQVENVGIYRSSHEAEAAPLLNELQGTARRRENTFEALMNAAKVCSLGSMSHALYEVGGENRRNM